MGKKTFQIIGAIIGLLLLASMVYSIVVNLSDNQTTTIANVNLGSEEVDLVTGLSISDLVDRASLFVDFTGTDASGRFLSLPEVVGEPRINYEIVYVSKYYSDTPFDDMLAYVNYLLEMVLDKK